jgi:hypothetical protein
MTTYNVKYVYTNPSGAGPFKGRGTSSIKYAKGEDFYGAPFGHATVVSCSKVKESVIRSFQDVCDSQLARR